ncbi:grasp-with-spasm system ATP-grasp peptide maturase [Kordia sp.]|uniref:grasp-with-spasm system ATP-grasp peptide maturase n=1 Tax=Kordia sp. TaxID=1965332 RepID=UPI003B5A99FA
MILILCESKDLSVSEVIDWISFLGYNYKRVNTDHLIDGNYTLKLTNDQVSYQSNSITDDVSMIWYRGGSEVSSYKYPVLEKINAAKSRVIYNSMKMEKKMLKKSLYDNVLEKEWLSNPLQIDKSNKISTLRLAKECGVDIPSSLITNSKQELLDFLNEHKELIVKPIYEAYDFNLHKEEIYMEYTSSISLPFIQKLEATFFPSLFQERLQKEFEIRSFYLDGDFYSMAIFSQNDSQTEVDFRRYNNEKPNRSVPFKLPENIEKKINKLMRTMELKTGSIDIVKTKDGRYVFLEVNPIGQFGMVSGICNYNLEKIIATYLIKNEKWKKQVKS